MFIENWDDSRNRTRNEDDIHVHSDHELVEEGPLKLVACLTRSRS